MRVTKDERMETVLLRSQRSFPSSFRPDLYSRVQTLQVSAFTTIPT